MIDRMKQFLAPPVFEDEEKSRVAGLLKIMLLTLLGVTLFYGLLAPFSHPERALIFLLTSAGLTILWLNALWLAQRRWVRLVSILFPSVLWLLVTLIIINAGGIRSPSAINYFTVILVSGIVLGGRAGILFAALTMLTTLSLVYAEINQLLPPVRLTSTLNSTWSVLAGNFAVVAVFLYMANRSLTRAITRGRHNEAALADSNQKLKEQAAALQASEERYRIITELISDYAYACQVEPDGSYALEWITADSARRMFGYDPHYEIGSPLLPYHPEDQARAGQDVHQAVAGQRTSAEYRIITKAGELHWLHIDHRPAWDPTQQRVVRVYGVAQDITMRKQAEAEQEQLIADLEAKNAELERFTYTVSHDLKSPLVTINGFLGLLEKDIARGNSEQIRGDIEHIRDAAKKMQLLLNDLLELSRIGQLINPPELINLIELAREAMGLVAGQIARRGVQIDVAPDMSTVWGDRPRLLEVFQNLIDNAVKFMGDQSDPRIEIGSQQIEAETVYFVRDNGIGIEPRYHDQVFGLFNRLDLTIEGTGIGLALVKRIVEVHGGRIWVESEGAIKGSTFLFTLPLAAGEVSDNERASGNRGGKKG